MKDGVTRAFKKLAREIWVITSAYQGRQGGLIATFVSDASIVPQAPRLVIGLAKQHNTHELVDDSGAFVAHLLADSQIDLVKHFGQQSGRDIDKLADIKTRTGETGAPILEVCAGWLECRVESSMDTGDRTVFLAEVVDGDMLINGSVLTDAGLLNLISIEQASSMRAARERDAEVDAKAIAEWRAARAQSDS